MDVILIRLVNMGFSGLFSDPYYRYIQSLKMDMILIRLVDMGFNGLFSDPHCRYTEPKDGYDINQTGGHGF